MPPLMFYSTTRKEIIEQHTKLGLDYHAFGLYDHAIIHFQHIIQLNRQDARAYFHRDFAAIALHEYIHASPIDKNKKLEKLKYYICPLNSSSENSHFSQ